MMMYVNTFTITDPPISPNPKTVSENSTHHTLSWSPPFLWPGHRIGFYNVVLVALKDGRIDSTNIYRVNSSYTSAIVTITVDICRNLKGNADGFAFVISPITTTPLALPSFNISTTSKEMSKCCTINVATTPFCR